MTFISPAGKAGATALLAGLGLLALAPAGRAAPAALPGYTVTPFATSIGTAYSAPDSILVYGGNVFVSYAGGTDPTGVSGSTTLVEYNGGGAILNTFSILGSNDGLKIDPSTGLLWALRNQDANPALTTIDPVTGARVDYTYVQDNPTPHGGGYDDAVFQNGNVYLSASNPNTDAAGNVSATTPTILKAVVNAATKTISVTPVLFGTAAATDTATGKPVTLDLTDPDSLTLTPSGSLLLTDQTANQLVTVTNPGLAGQTVGVVSLLDPTGKSVTVDDTLFTGATAGSILVAATGANTVYKVTGFLPGAAYSASNSDSFLGSLNLGTGGLTPVVTGLTGAHGLAFLPSAAVPEASPLALLGLGLLPAGLLLAARRRSAN